MEPTLTLKTYLERVQGSNSNTNQEQEELLKTLHSDESIEIMWETFTLQCNAAMEGNISIENAVKVNNLSTQYLAALEICRTLHTRFDSVTRIIYDLKELYDNNITDTVEQCIREKELFVDLSSEKQKRESKVIELLEEIQKPINRKDKEKGQILEKAIQRHCEILYTALLLSDNDSSYFAFIKEALPKSDDDFYNYFSRGKSLGFAVAYLPSNLRSILCELLFNTIDEFHTYLAEISKEE